MEITINIDVLSEKELSFSEYVYLKATYENREPEELKKIFSCIDRIEEDSLQERGFLKVTEEGVVLRDKARKLFESASLFNKFLTTFPIKTPDGRYLSPAGTEGVKAKKLQKKWKQLFKNKPHKERRAIEVLEAELKWRRENDKMKYIHNMETWLNQGDYENFEYLLDEFGAQSETYDDFM